MDHNDWINDKLEPCKKFEVPTDHGFLHIVVIGIGDDMRIEVTEFIKKPDEAVNDLISGKTSFYDMVRRQQKRAENLTNVTPVPTPFMDLIS